MYQEAFEDDDFLDFLRKEASQPISLEQMKQQEQDKIKHQSILGIIGLYGPDFIPLQTIIKTKSRLFSNDPKCRRVQKHRKVKKWLMDYVQTLETKSTIFEGSMVNEMAGIIYLLKKFPHGCTSAIVFDLDETRHDIINNTFIEWNDETNTLTFSRGFTKAFLHCLQKPNVRFVFGLITLRGNVGGHANCFVYDHWDASVELFDPNGVTVGYDLTKFSEKLRYYFEQLGILKQNFHAFTNFCPRESFQHIQFQENLQTKDDPEGFCSAWSIWWIDFRLTNSHLNVSRKQLVQEAIKGFKSNLQKQSMTDFIRNYANHIVKERNAIISEALDNMSDDVKNKMINAWEDLRKWQLSSTKNEANREELLKRKNAFVKEFGTSFEYHIAKTLNEILGHETSCSNVDENAMNDD